MDKHWNKRDWDYMDKHWNKHDWDYMDKHWNKHDGMGLHGQTSE